MKIALGQINPIVGDIDGNVAKMLDVLRRVPAGTDVTVFPELSVTGYPPRDLLCQREFLAEVVRAVQQVVDETSKLAGMTVIFGAPVVIADGVALFNSAIIAEKGAYSIIHKALLPTYDVFDETRYFVGAQGESESIRPDLGVTICEDAWSDSEFWPNGVGPYSFDPVAARVKEGAKILINISASPFSVGKPDLRCQLVSKHAMKHKMPFIYVNQVGGNDELIFDGRSMVVNAEGQLIGEAKAFEEDLLIVDTDEASPINYEIQDDLDDVACALTLGVRDYFKKCGFSKAVIGLSGGIDSAVVAVLAVRALGSENVMGVTMPSKYNDDRSKTISETLASNLGIGIADIPILDLFDEYNIALGKVLGGNKSGVTYENIQARIRGNILMAISNKYGHLVLSTGNKSELAVGYCTLYGDMCGGLAVISDVPKTMVYDLARWFNKDEEVIPKWIITRPPSAELRDDQCDQDTLPEYDVLDGILKEYLENGKSRREIIDKGYAEKDVTWVVETVAKNEYKRRQAAPGLRVTTKAFGVGRRYPIAAKFGK